MVAASLVIILARACWGGLAPQKKAASGSASRPSAAAADKISGAWLGQDGHDLASPSAVAEPSGVQDIHIVLKGLPTGTEIEFLSIKGHGADEWQVEPPHGVWRAVLVRDPNKTTADLYLEPTRVETGRIFEFTLRFKDGSTTAFYVGGGKADPRATHAGRGGSGQVGGAGPARSRGPGTQCRARRTPGCSYRAIEADQRSSN